MMQSNSTTRHQALALWITCGKLQVTDAHRVSNRCKTSSVTYLLPKTLRYSRGLQLQVTGNRYIILLKYNNNNIYKRVEKYSYRRKIRIYYKKLLLELSVTLLPFGNHWGIANYHLLPGKILLPLRNLKTFLAFADGVS